MVSTSFASRNSPHPYANQSQTQYLKEAFGVPTTQPPPPPPLHHQQQGANDIEWPSLNMSMFAGESHAAAQHRAMQGTNARRTNVTMGLTHQQHPQMQRRPSSIGRLQQQELARSIALQQQANQQIQKQNSGSGATIKNPKLYKTELCRSWGETGRCNYGERCQYAHGETEKRPIPRHPKYKSEPCQSYHQSGYCAYGARCHFIHNEDAQMLAQMVAANAAATAAKQHNHALHQHHHQQQQQQQSTTPIRPTNLFTSGLGVQSSPPQRATPPGLAMMRSGSLTTPMSAYNQSANMFGRQFQAQLQIFNDTLKNINTAPTATPPAHQVAPNGEISSTGDSPIPSSNGSGTESPICSFSPGSELDDPSFVFVRKQLEAIKLVGPVAKMQNPLGLLPSSLNSDIESGFSSSSSTSSQLGTKSLNSPVVGSPPHLAPAANPWSPQSVAPVGTPTSSGGGRLPVFERLSNGP